MSRTTRPFTHYYSPRFASAEKYGVCAPSHPHQTRALFWFAMQALRGFPLSISRKATQAKPVSVLLPFSVSRQESCRITNNTPLLPPLQTHTLVGQPRPRESMPPVLLLFVVVAFLRACSSLFFVLITTPSLQLSCMCLSRLGVLAICDGGSSSEKILDLGMNCEERGRGEVNWQLVLSLLDFGSELPIRF